MRSPESPQAHARRDAVERLYVLWIVSTLLLITAALLPSLLLRNALRKQNDAMEQLGARMVAAEKALTQLAAAPPPPADQPPAPAHAADEPPTQVESAAAPRPTPASAPATVSDAAIQAEIAHVLEESDPGEFVLHDSGAAARLLEGVAALASPQWNSRTWERLALVAALLQKPEADTYGRRAAEFGRPPLRYYALAARIALAENQPADALGPARSLAEHAPDNTAGKVYLAAALLASGEPAAADELLDQIGRLTSLTPRERVLLARLSVELENWARLRDAINGVPNVAAPLAPERDFLNAVNLLQQNRPKDAFALLDNLAAAAPQKRAERSFPPPPQPAAWEIQMWRGVALFRSGQAEAARQALDAAAESWPDRAAVWYWRGVLDLKQRDFDSATRHLNNALAVSANFAPAWEGLATIALDAGDVNQALACLESARKANPRRPSAHFLSAIAFAKADQTEDAAEALRATFTLAPTMVEEAARTEVLARLFTLEDLRVLAAPPAAEDANGAAHPENGAVTRSSENGGPKESAPREK